MEWIVEVRPPKDSSGNNRIQLGLKNSDNQEVVWVTNELDSLIEWKQQVQKLQSELMNALQRGEDDWLYQQQVEAITQKQEQMSSPEKIWENMQKFEDEQDMRSYFNQLGREERKMTAEYILSQVSMFKGKAPYFAQNYDFNTNKLG